MAEAAVEQIDAGLFKAVIPLPNNPLKATNSYIIKDERRNLIIDTGMNRKECRSAMDRALAELEIDLCKTDIFVTHLHADHLGLVDNLSREGTLIYLHRADAWIMKHEGLWAMVTSLTEKHGFPGELVEKAINSHPGQRYSPGESLEFTMVNDGDTLEYGDYKLKCVVTPGHTEGHTCLYEPGRKYLFSGDHILGDITPNISTWLDEGNSLGDYFQSLDKVAEMPVELVLPGHRSLVRDCHGRIEELKEHHQRRLEEVLKILRNSGPSNAFMVASQMTWDLIAKSWDDFPLMQQWFATGEALAHLRFLEVEGKVKRKEIDKTAYFSLI